MKPAWLAPAALAATILGLCTVALAGRGATAVELTEQAQDDDFARRVREWTTKPEFTSPLVDHLPKTDGPPSPRDVLGHHVGAPNVLTSYDQAVGYYRALAAKSPRVKIIPIGTTDEGRESIVVAIGSEDSIAHLDQYREYLSQLADPRRLDEQEARAVIAKAKPIYHIMAGLHARETGPVEMLMELAYRLAVEDSPLVRAIRDKVIVTLTPAADPDGHDRYVDWYYRYKAGPDNQDSEDELTNDPPYWGKYVFHDNNRDINYSQLSSRRLLAWYLQWHPPIMHDLHESQPFLFTFSGQAPQNPALDPILYGELPWFSNFEMAQLTKYGMPGVWTHAFVDAWSPGYLGFMASNHNGMLRMYESFGNYGATTMKRRTDRGNEGPSVNPTTREWYRPRPPYREVEWSMRNGINYMETGILSALQLTAAFPEIVLDNFYQKSRNAVASALQGPPFAYVIPAGQPDMTRAAAIVSILRMQGIEVGRSASEIRVAEGVFPIDSYVIMLDQPYGRLARILLERQEFPDPTLRSYDDTAWTMGLMSRVDVREIDDHAIHELGIRLVTDDALEGTVAREGETPAPYIAVAHLGSNNMIALRYRLKDLKVESANLAFEAEGLQFPAGSYLIGTEGMTSASMTRVEAAIKELGLTGARLAERPQVATHALDLPRLAVYSTWGDTQDVGWVRYAFDTLGVAYDLIFKERVRKGGLRQAYDVLIVPNQGRNARELVYDITPKGRPLAYTKTERFKNLGMYGESDDITGGMGLQGVEEIERFVQQGGLLLTLGTASYLPPEFGLTREVDATRPPPQFYAPGPIVRAEIQQASHPIFYGYEDRQVPVRYANGPLLQVPEANRAEQVLMSFPGGERNVLSGLMRGADQIRDRAAIVEVPEGRGHVILFATNPCYRWQNLGEFNMLFNAVLNFNDLPAPKKGAPPQTVAEAAAGATPSAPTLLPATPSHP